MADPFEVELEQLVAKVARGLAQDITALILRRLGIAGPDGRAGSGIARAGALGRGSAARLRGAANGREKPASARPQRARPGGTGGGAPRIRATREERTRIAAEVERVIGAGSGLSLGQIERASSLPRGAVTAALKTLKEEGRAFMGGTKRFARYAATQAQADRASLDARRAGE
jgi:hypothetical protein